MEGRFVVKMEWRKRDGIGGHVQRVIEGLDLRMISIVVNEKNPDVMSSTAFLEVISQHFDLWPLSNFFSLIFFLNPLNLFIYLFIIIIMMLMISIGAKYNVVLALDKYYIYHYVRVLTWVDSLHVYLAEFIEVLFRGFASSHNIVPQVKF